MTTLDDLVSKIKYQLRLIEDFRRKPRISVTDLSALMQIKGAALECLDFVEAMKKENARAKQPSSQNNEH